MKETILHIGFDDTDSTKGMCTTFLAYKIVEYLKKEKVKFLDYPYLIRFNPNIPWKTRGNGAVALKIGTDKPSMIKKNIIQFITKYSAIKEGANPGLVFYENKEIPKHFSEFGKFALHDIISRKKAKEFVSQNNLEAFYIGNGQGLVGAIGAIGYDFRDFTYELISYRHETNFGKKRVIIKESVKTMQKTTFPQTYNNYDESKDRVLIAPHGPDPVFFGVRGEDVDSVIRGASLVNSKEKFHGYMVFRSNQGTGDHLLKELDAKNLKPFSSGTLVGKVLEKPKIERGGHVIFSIETDSIKINCAVYKPTGLAQMVSKLIKGDLVKVGGGVRKASKNHQRILNIEFLEVLELEKNFVFENPICPQCKKHMKSRGRDQGYECNKCFKTSQYKISRKIPREIEKQLYLPILSAHRHLSRPLQRMNRFNTNIKFDNSKKWFCNSN